MNRTRIEWCDYSWNPTSGCSFGCSYCFARKMSARFHRSFEPTCHPEKLDEPLKLKKPARIFVDSAGDLFDPAIPDEFIQQVIYAMTPGHWRRSFMPEKSHTYIVLTKQAKRMRTFFDGYWSSGQYRRTPCFAGLWPNPPEATSVYSCRWRNPHECGEPGYCGCPWPLPHLWLGVTTETQKAADERITWLMQTPAAIRFASLEPLLGPIDLRNIQIPAGGHVDVLQGADVYGPNGIEHEKRWHLDWVICGDDSSPGAKMPDSAWVESLIEQCRAAGVPVWVKGRLHDRWPNTELPEVH